MRKGRRSYFIIKRLFDIILSFIGIISLIPITIVLKIIFIICGDFHSIFYCQDRIGKNGKAFKIFKYRTMVKNADEELNNLLKEDKYKKEWDKTQKINDDPRTTKIGKFLRKHSFDELPQFINIFIGNMSLIGPRPLIIGELDKHNGNHKLYESIKPGLTGYWIINRRKDEKYYDRLKLEYYYINNICFKLDLLILLKTIKIVL